MNSFIEIVYKDPEDNQETTCIVAFPDIRNSEEYISNYTIEQDFGDDITAKSMLYHYKNNGSFNLSGTTHKMRKSEKNSFLFDHSFPYSHHCSSNASTMFRNYMYTITAIGFVLPLTIIIFCYSRILAVMHSSSEKVYRFANSRIVQESMRLKVYRKQQKFHSNLKGMAPRRKVTMLVANLVISFVICWLPFHSWHIVRLSGVEITAMDACTYIRDITFCLAYFNSVLNPLLYSFLGYGFRNRFVNAVRKIKRACSIKRFRSPLQRRDRKGHNVLEYL